MKRHVKKGGMAMVLSLFFVLGGLFLVNDVQAQQYALTQVVSPQQNWISSGAAQSQVAAEIDALTAKYQQMKQAGSEPSELHKVKLELQLYMAIEGALEHGLGTQEAFELAWESVGIGLGEDATSTSIMSPAEAQAIYDKAIGKLTD